MTGYLEAPQLERESQPAHSVEAETDPLEEYRTSRPAPEVISGAELVEFSENLMWGNQISRWTLNHIDPTKLNERQLAMVNFMKDNFAAISE